MKLCRRKHVFGVFNFVFDTCAVWFLHIVGIGKSSQGAGVPILANEAHALGTKNLVKGHFPLGSHAKDTITSTNKKD
jgi:hypothetical protein